MGVFRCSTQHTRLQMGAKEGMPPVSLLLHRFGMESSALTKHQDLIPSSGQACPVALGLSGPGGQGPREEHGPSAELVFSVRDRWVRPRPWPFQSRSLAACEARDCGRASTRNLSVPSPLLVLVCSSFIRVGERGGGGARAGIRG